MIEDPEIRLRTRAIGPSVLPGDRAAMQWAIEEIDSLRACALTTLAHLKEFSGRLQRMDEKIALFASRVPQGGSGSVGK